MHDIFFYRDRNGFEPVAEFIEELAKRNDKDSRVQLHKIRDYLKILSEHGTFAGEPFVKHLDGEIWELRPLRNRIVFVAWINGSFVLLHPFLKQSQKTPVREIEKAKRELADLKERGMENG